MQPRQLAGSTAALYLRRSTEDKQEHSLDTQRSGAERYCKAHGWRVTQEFVDDGISRAEFVKRHSLRRMLEAARLGEFQILVTRDGSRLGGDQLRTTQLLQDLRDANVSVVYYSSDELVQIDSSLDRLLLSVRGFADENEREKISSRVSERLTKKAREGLAYGAPAYGYTIKNDAFAVVNKQAAVVRDIFTRYAKGEGTRVIASELNAQGVPSPRGKAAWGRTTVRQILTREAYAGRGSYGRSKRVYRGGTRVTEQRHGEDVATFATPRIVDDSLWQAVCSRLASNPRFGASVSKCGKVSKHLLVGLARCGVCGGPLSSERGARQTQVYRCRTFRDKGACTNHMAILMTRVDALLVQAVRDALTPARVTRVVKRLRERLLEQRQAEPLQRVSLEADAARLRKELARLTLALAATENADSVVDAIKERTRRLREVDAQLVLAASPSAETRLESLPEVVSQAVAQLAETFTEQPIEAKAVLRALVGDTLRLTSDELVGSISVYGLLPAGNCDTTRSCSDTVRFVVRLRASS